MNENLWTKPQPKYTKNIKKIKPKLIKREGEFCVPGKATDSQGPFYSYANKYATFMRAWLSVEMPSFSSKFKPVLFNAETENQSLSIHIQYDKSKYI